MERTRKNRRLWKSERLHLIEADNLALIVHLHGVKFTCKYFTACKYMH